MWYLNSYVGLSPHPATVATRILCVCFFVGTPMDLHLPLLMCWGWTQWKYIYISYRPILMFHLAPIEIVGKKRTKFGPMPGYQMSPKALLTGVPGYVRGRGLVDHAMISRDFNPNCCNCQVTLKVVRAMRLRGGQPATVQAPIRVPIVVVALL